MPNRTLREILGERALVHANVDDTVADTVKRMHEAHVGSALIFEHGALRGIFTGSNLFDQVLSKGKDPNDIRVGDVMTAEPVCLECRALGFEAVREMRERGIRHIAVLRADGGFGVVSVRDFPDQELDGYEDELKFENRLWESI